MITKEDWNTVYFTVIPLLGVGVSAVGVAIGLLALQRSQAQAVGIGSLEPATGYAPLGVNTPKVHYADSQVLVEVRNPGEWHELREFINPLDPGVQRIYHQVGPDAWALLDWVCKAIEYRFDDGEWWGFPGETLYQKKGDCDDSSILTCSLLRNFTDCYVAVGSYRGFGHAWCQTDGYILETTYSYAHDVPDPQNYRAYAMFNDEQVIEMWPGALSQLFQLARNEYQKLSFMAEAQRGAL
jgi:hypothetical protein